MDESVFKNVIAALRLAEEATDSWERFGAVVSEILKWAPPTDATAGAEVLIAMQQEGLIEFSLVTVDS